MLFKRNHTLKYKKVLSTGSYQDENGDWQPGTTTEAIIELECRSEPNGQRETIPSQNGQDVVFKRIVFLDFDMEDIPFETTVQVFNNCVLLSEDTVKLFERDQKKCRLWI